ncbi:MAG: PLP-dependent aminotransferase family protein, partial [Gemmatimonadaceae bacterium]
LARRASQLSAGMPPSAPAANIAFDSGHAFPGVLPDLTVEAERALSHHRAEVLQYAPRPGLPELRSRIADLMADDGVDASPHHVLVTNGAKHALELICRLLLDEGDSIVVTAPTYFTAIPIFRSFGVSFIEVGQDGEGLDVGELALRLRQAARDGTRLPKFIYHVPDFHNPTGVSMSLERRKALIDLATEHRIFIVEDSPYRRVRFDGPAVPPLKALDRGDVVFYVGTFSKLMAPGLRVGWAAASPDLIARMIQLKSDGGSCPLTQRVIVEFLAAGRLASHIHEVQATYRANRDRMIAALTRELPEVRMEVPRGGYYLWLTLPLGMNGDELARCASEAGVTVLAGSSFFARADAGHPKHHLRVAYSHANGDEIDEGVRRLASAFRIVAERPAPVAAR